MLNATLMSAAMMAATVNQTGRLGYSESCLQYIMQLVNETIQAETILKYLAVSGHAWNQLGLYEDCLDMVDSTYFLSFLSYGGQPLPLFIGFCFTDKCSTKDITQLVDSLGTPYGFTNLIEPSKWHAPVDALTYFTLALLCLLVLLWLAGTLLTCYYSNRKKQGPLVRLSKYFSLQNGLESLKVKPGELKYLNGVRALSFVAVVFGHELYLHYTFSENYVTMAYQLGKAYIVYIYSYVFCVDVFFFIGGFLVGLLFLKMFFRRPEWMLFPKALVQRVLRFWPVYIVTVLLYWKIAPLLGDGPLYYTLADYVNTCKDSYWSDLLFFSNWRNALYCTGWTWYVSVDMQLFVVSLAILAVYVYDWRYSKLCGRLLAFATLIGTVIYVFVQCQIHHYRTFTGTGDNPENVADYQTKIYLRPWSRASPYMLGLLTGIFYYNFQEAKKRGQKLWIDKLYRWRLFRMLSTAGGLFLIGMYIYAPYNLLNGKSEWTQTQHSLYLSTGHVGFTFGLLCILMPIYLEYPNPIQTFLEIGLLQLVAKLSFSSYMIHFVVMIRLACNVKSSQYTDPWKVFTCACSDIVVVLVCGFLVYVIVECPFSSLLDAAFGKSKGRVKEKKRLLEDQK